MLGESKSSRRDRADDAHTARGALADRCENSAAGSRGQGDDCIQGRIRFERLVRDLLFMGRINERVRLTTT